MEFFLFQCSRLSPRVFLDPKRKRKSQEAPNLLKGNKLPPVWIKSIKPEHVAPQRNDTTVMIGDSIIKGLRNDLLSHAAKRRVTVRKFPTASSSDMKHYLQPSLQLEPS